MLSRIVAAVALALATVTACLAQDWPTQTVRFIVPFAAGGPADTAARLTADELSKQLPQRVVIENRTGAGNVVGTEAVARAPKDGYTFLFTTSSHAHARALNAKLPFDPVADFQPVSVITVQPHVLIVNNDFPARNLRDVIATVRASPDKFNFGTAGTGSATHFYFELFMSTAGGLKMNHIPYRGSPPALLDLMSGQVSLMTDPSSSCLPYIKDGRVRAIAISSKQRSPALADVPTFAESGVAAFAGYEVYGWYMLLAPAGIPDPILRQTSAAVRKALATPALTQRFTQLNMDATPDSTPERATQYLRDETAKWNAVALKAGIKPN
jgi:tripartite-type tricarboxylate transporter receptor subunit TctC